MDILVVDDLRSFPFPARYARTSAEALAILNAAERAGEGFSVLLLDHDLGLVDGQPDDVRPVVDWLAERAVWGTPFPVGRVVVHTSNPPGAEMIVRALDRWYDVVRVDPAACGAISG